MDIEKHPERMQPEDYRLQEERKQQRRKESSSSSSESSEDEEEQKPIDMEDQLLAPAKEEEVTDQPQKQQQQKKKKKKKKKREQQVEEETDYEVDIIKKAKTSDLLKCETIQEHLRPRYAIIEANPWLLVVSNIPPMITSFELKDYFNALISKLRPEFANPLPIVNVEVATSKQFSTLQFATKQAKHYALTLKGIEFQKCKLVIEKPKQYFYRVYLENVQLEDVMVDVEEGTLNQLQMNKIYLGGLPTYLKDADVRKLAENFGKLKYFNVAKQLNENKEQVSKGYCFFEYEDSQITDKAIKALNGLPCGDRKLKVSRVTKDQNKLAHTQQIQNERNKQAPSNNGGSYLGGCELIKRQDVIQMLTIPEFAWLPSRVIQLLNMVSIEDLFEDDVFDELYQDVLTECEKIGPVEKIEIPKPCKITGICPPSIGKVFVKFKYMLKAKKARHSLSGRTYNRRTVIVSFYPEDKFDHKDFLFSIE